VVKTRTDGGEVLGGVTDLGLDDVTAQPDVGRVVFLVLGVFDVHFRYLTCCKQPQLNRLNSTVSTGRRSRV